MNQLPRDEAVALLDRIRSGDTLAVIEAQEWFDAICDQAQSIVSGSIHETDYSDAVCEAGGQLLAAVLAVLYGHDYETDDAAGQAVYQYRLNGGREVRYHSHRVTVWLNGSDPTWQIFDL